MKNQLKSLAVILLCTASLSTSAQNLISKISNQASFVLEVNGENSFKDVSILEVENSLLFKEIMDEFFGHSKMIKPSSFADMGININSKMYVASENQTDITYFYFSSTIKNLPKFNGFIKSAMNKENNNAITTVNGLNQIINDSKTRLVWNDSYFIFITSIYNGQKYKEDYYSSWREYDFTTDTTIEESEAIDVLEEAIEEATEEAGEVVETIDESYSADYEIIEETEEVVETTEDVYYESEYDKKKRLQRAAFDKNEENKKNKKAIFIDSALTARIDLYFTDNLANKFSATGFDNSAVASIWYNGMDLANLYSTALYGNGYENPIDFLGLKNFYNAEYFMNLYLEEDKISIKSNVEFSENLKQSTDKIYNSKLDRKFCKYLSENTLAYSSFSMSTEDLLNETATITKDYFKTASSFEYSEEVSVYIDFLQIMLDEEAIAELVTGDGVLLLNDLSSKTVEYKSWEYDDNFNEKEVTKTKQELLPEFTFMIGSQNEEILTKLFKLSMKHEFLSGKEGYFVSSEKFQNELPFDMYLCFKDGILFMTNSKTQLQSILNGKAENKMSRGQRKQIMKSIASVYINMEEITSKLMADETFSKELSEFNDFKGDIKQFVSTSSYKRNKLTMDAYISIPEGEANSATYLLRLVDKVIAKSK